MSDQSQDHLYTETFFARQPIFDAQKMVWGYELLYRQRLDTKCADINLKDLSTLTVLSNILANPPHRKEGTYKVLIHFTRKSILDELPQALPPSNTVIEIEQGIEIDPELTSALDNLKQCGYLIALNKYNGDPRADDILDLADMVFIDMLEHSRNELIKIRKTLNSRQIMLAAKRVETLDHFRFAQSLGFQLFLGFFFEKPTIVPGRKICSNSMTRLHLFKYIESPKPDFDKLADIIQSDVSISYRLLRYINSPYFGFQKKITSLKQALVLLGFSQIRSWLRVIILDKLLSVDKSSELPFLAAIRGKFLELVASQSNTTGIEPDSLFLLGLFSILESLLDQPMKEIVDALPLDDRIKQALCDQKNDLWFWLEMAKCFESGNWAYLDSLLEKISLDPSIVANSYGEALKWTQSFFQESS